MEVMFIKILLIVDGSNIITTNTVKNTLIVDTNEIPQTGMKTFKNLTFISIVSLSLWILRKELEYLFANEYFKNLSRNLLSYSIVCSSRHINIVDHKHSYPHNNIHEPSKKYTSKFII